jgi:NADH-quinone oxidoreductase subunit I
MVKIEVNYERCQTPFDCKKCLVICPQAVFVVGAVKVERFKETDPKEPGAYQLTPFYLDKCTACGDCVNVCPQDALKISTVEA